MQTDLPAHPQAFLQMHTGSFQFVRPSLGAWTLYGLGSENENLPGFVTLTPPAASGGAQNYGSSFLPAIYQGTRIGADNRPIAGAEIRNLHSPLRTEVQRAELDLLQTLNRETLRLDRFNPDVEGVIESYELAFRMQKEMPQVMDLSGESEATKKLYGIADGPGGDGRGQGAATGAPMTSAGNACSLGAWSRPACALWKSRTETGTSTSTSPLRSEQTAARSISRSPGCSPISSSAGCSRTRW